MHAPGAGSTPGDAVTPEDWDLAARFRDAVRQEYPDALLLLIGSRARGEGRTDSDYDFLVISHEFGGVSPLWRAQPLRRLWRRLGAPVDVDLLCGTPDEYERARARSTSWISEAHTQAIVV